MSPGHEKELFIQFGLEQQQPEEHHTPPSCALVALFDRPLYGHVRLGRFLIIHYLNLIIKKESAFLSCPKLITS